MKLDSNLAWKEAVATVSANREVLLALAGVFFMLPSLAIALFFPQPEPQGDMQPEQMMAMLQQYYLSALPFMIPMAIVQTIGSLAMLTLFTDRSRPTVGEAIRQGAIGVIFYFATQLLVVLAIGIVGLLLVVLAGLIGSAALGVVVGLVLLAGVFYLMLRLALVAPVIAVDRVRNPIAVLRRAWSLTTGNAGSIALFLLLVIVVFVVIVVVAMGIAGVVLALVVGGSTAKAIAAVFSSALGAVFSLYFMAIIAAIHRQLSGSSAEAISVTFD